MRTKIFITGGHLTPALAVMAKLAKKGSWEIYFVGRKYTMEDSRSISAEYQLLSPKMTFLSITTGRLQPKFFVNVGQSVRSLLKIPVGFGQAFYWILRYRPRLILSFGGYLALPVVFAGWMLGVLIMTHEQTLSPGLSNKIIELMADRILLSWPGNGEARYGNKSVVTGNPVREEIFKVNQTENYKKYNAIRKKNLKLPVIYVTGGNQGSRVINDTVLEILPSLLRRYLVIHQTGGEEGSSYFEKYQEKVIHLTLAEKNRYFVFEYVFPPDIGWVMQEADLVVGRAGANTVSELAVLGKPAVLIPIPWSRGNEQFRNAEMLAFAGGAEIIAQEDLTGLGMLSKIDQVTANLANYQKGAVEAKKLIRLDAAERIAAEASKMVS